LLQNEMCLLMLLVFSCLPQSFMLNIGGVMLLIVKRKSSLS